MAVAGAHVLHRVSEKQPTYWIQQELWRASCIGVPHRCPARYSKLSESECANFNEVRRCGSDYVHATEAILLALHRPLTSAKSKPTEGRRERLAIGTHSLTYPPGLPVYVAELAR